MPPRISVVIPTFQRAEACAAAVEAALAQTLEPLEVLVCDDGSEDETPERFTEWERRDPRVRYLRLPHRGTPGPTRNAGVRAAEGEWIAFCDDDDRWLPEKLEVQAAHLAPRRVVATNARLTSGPLYFPDLDHAYEPTQAEMLRVNPIVVSTAVAEREALLASGGFAVERWARGVADFGMWLALADRGARFVVLPDVTVDYQDDGTGRMSSQSVRQEFALARLAWRHWARRPTQLARLTAAGNHSVAAAQNWWFRRRGVPSA